MKQNPKIRRIQFGVIDVNHNQSLKNLIKRKNSEILLYVKQKKIYKEIHSDDLNDHITDFFEDIYDEFNTLEKPLKSYLNNNSYSLKERLFLELKSFSFSHFILVFLMTFLVSVIGMKKNISFALRVFGAYFVVSWIYIIVKQIIRHYFL